MHVGAALDDLAHSEDSRVQHRVVGMVSLELRERLAGERDVATAALGIPQERAEAAPHVRVVVGEHRLDRGQIAAAEPDIGGAPGRAELHDATRVRGELARARVVRRMPRERQRDGRVALRGRLGDRAVQRGHRRIERGALGAEQVERPDRLLAHRERAASARTAVSATTTASWCARGSAPFARPVIAPSTTSGSALPISAATAAPSSRRARQPASNVAALLRTAAISLASAARSATAPRPLGSRSTSVCTMYAAI